MFRQTGADLGILRRGGGVLGRNSSRGGQVRRNFHIGLLTYPYLQDLKGGHKGGGGGYGGDKNIDL